MASDLSSIGADGRLAHLIEVLEHMAGGDLTVRAAISPTHDELDAVAHGVNVLAGELQYSAIHLRQAKERAEQANGAKTVFLRNVSHEIRTPLTAMLSIVQLMRAPHSDDRRQELLEKIASNGRWLMALVDDLLDLAKLESGKLMVNSVPFSALSVIEEVVHDLEAQAHCRGIELGCEAVLDRRHMMLGDAKHVRQIINNLVANAIKFTERGRICVRLTAETSSPLAFIDVSDTGMGLSQTQAELLFEPFMQADRSISERFGGTGLGLALSRRLAREMGGDLALLCAAPGRGATFRLSLPTAEEQPAPAPVVTEPRDHAAHPDLRGMRVLFAEDNSDIREAAAALLGLMGASVVEVGDGLQALERASRERFDVVLMDINMPGIDGLEATRRLRAIGIGTPIVALTADAILQDREQWLAAGYTACLAKPYHIEGVAAAILRSCRRR